MSRLIDADALVKHIAWNVPLKYFGAMKSSASICRADTNETHIINEINKFPTVDAESISHSNSVALLTAFSKIDDWVYGHSINDDYEKIEDPMKLIHKFILGGQKNEAD